MRILHVHDVAFVATNIVAGFQNLGIVSELYEFKGLDKEVSCKIVKGLSKLYYHFFEIFQFRKFLKNKKFDIVHIHFGSFAYLAYLNKIPYYLHIHGSDIRKFIHYPVLGLVIKKGIKKAEKVFYSTPDLMRLIKPIREDAIFFPNPVDVSLFKPSQVTFDECKYDVLSISKIDRYKGIEKVIETIEMLLIDYPELKVISFGFGNDSLSLKKLDRLKRKHVNLKIINGVSHNEMVELINNSKIVLGQMSLGSLGCAEIEAMACAKPVVCKFTFGSMYPSPPPVVTTTECKEAYEIIIDLLENPDQAKEIGLNARNWIIENSRKEIVAKRLLEIYTSSA
jgi:glycosyltransferase involved in cell wall biosynthesis